MGLQRYPNGRGLSIPHLDAGQLPPKPDPEKFLRRPVASGLDSRPRLAPSLAPPYVPDITRHHLLRAPQRHVRRRSDPNRATIAPAVLPEKRGIPVLGIWMRTRSQRNRPQ